MSADFGPVNYEGGERRLNVLITRARLAMEVFSNFTADDMKTESDSPFEEAVSDAIRRLGHDIEPQVGSAGFYIDIAVRDSQKPGRYILAVECDGASYHSSATARDRDRLRQSVLEGLGWRFHRIWSTDWFRDPHRESTRLKDSIVKALHAAEENPAPKPTPPIIIRDEPTETTYRPPPPLCVDQG